MENSPKLQPGDRVYHRLAPHVQMLVFETSSDCWVRCRYRTDDGQFEAEYFLPLELVLDEDSNE